MKTYNKLKDSKYVFLALLAYILLVLSLFLVESGRSGANINSIVDAAWYSIVTLTTVGYGDFYPVTALGKLIGFVLVIGSLGVIGYILGKLTEKFLDMREKNKLGLNGTDFKNHIILIGWDHFAATVTRQLVDSDHQVAIITENKDNVDLIYQEYSKDEVFVLVTDFKNIESFDKVNISTAFRTLVNLGDDTENLILILNIKNKFSDINFIVTLDNTELQETFKSAGVTYVLSRNEISSKLIASYIFEPDVASYTNDLITSAKETDEYDIQQFKVVDGNPYLGKTYGEAFSTLKSKHNVVLIGIAKNDNGNQTLLKLPSDDTEIDETDYLILIANGEKESALTDLFKIQEGIAR